MSTKETGVPCYDNAKPDEPVFVIRSQDILGPEIVRAWAHAAQRVGVNQEKIDDALNVADQMEEWQINNQKKQPD